MTELSLNLLRKPTIHAHSRASLSDRRAMGSAMLLERAVQGNQMTATLKQLLKGIPDLKIQGKDNVSVQSLATDSRRVVRGTMFFAIAGLRTDGHFFIAEAIDRGAAVIVSEKDVWVPPHVILVQTNDLRAVLAKVAARFYKHPEKEVELTGFLGTSGKTVASTLLRHFMGSSEDPVGLLGTIHYAVGNRTLPAHRTTPEPIELFGLLSQINRQGCRRALIEVSSHGIDQQRVKGLQFRNLVLLNLTPEHLHYHKSLENYIGLEKAYIKSQSGGLKHFIAGIDDPRVRQVWEKSSASLKSRSVPFGCSEDAVIRARDISYTEKDTRFTLVWPEGELKLVSPLLGEFNLQNTLAAIACAYVEGFEMGAIGAKLLHFSGVRGRMERLDVGQDYTVLVDYMHTEASYDKGLTMARSLTTGRLITIFGCGGNRDPKTRPVITQTVAEKSDIAIATADNPRNETVEAIFTDMRAGNEERQNLHFVEDRRTAIAMALEEARPGDTIIIAGKGHETFQEFGDCVVPFDDRAVAREIIQNKQWRGR